MKSFIYLSLCNTFILVLLLVFANYALYIHNSRYSSNWCSDEISILRDQVSDLWYINNLDKVKLND